MKHFMYYVATVLLSIPFLTLGMERITGRERLAREAEHRAREIAAEITKPSKNQLSVTLPDGSIIKEELFKEDIPYITKRTADGSLLARRYLSSLVTVLSMVVTNDDKIRITGEGMGGYFEGQLNFDLTWDETFGRSGVRQTRFSDIPR